MKVYKFSNINEANLNIAELSKTSKDGRLRGDSLVSKIKNSEPIIINKNGKKHEITVVNDIVPKITDDYGNYDANLAKQYFLLPNSRMYSSDAIEGDDGNFYKLKDVEKTEDFGSKGGHRKRASNTRPYESLACLVLAYRQQKGSDLRNEDFDLLVNMGDREFASYVKKIETKVEVTQSLLNDYREDWQNTFLKVANALYNVRTIVRKGKNSNFCLNRFKSYKFCQISSDKGICKSINDAYNRCISKLNIKPNIAKWNPSDLWAVNTRLEEAIISNLENCNHIKDLNDLINNYFSSRDLIGVSLKKVVKNENIKIIINGLTDPPSYEFLGISLSEDINTISIDIITYMRSYAFGNRKEVMTVRSFNSARISNISGEIKGLSAQQGKISLTQINNILSKHKVETVPPIEGNDIYNPLTDMSEGEMRKEIALINSLILQKYPDTKISRNVSSEQNIGRLYSKYQSLYLAWILMEVSETNPDKINDIIVEMFYYALSIRFDGFWTPKYVRVID